MKTDWTPITSQEFNHWKQVVRKQSKHIYYNELDNGKELRYFIKGGDNSKIFILTEVSNYCGVKYYKNSCVIGEMD